MVPKIESVVQSGAKSEGIVDFSKRDIKILQGLVDGKNWRVFRDEMNIAPHVLKVNKELIAERFNSRGYTSGLYKAIIETVRQGRLDTSNLPQEPKEPLDDFEVKFLSMVYKGNALPEICKSLGITKRKIIGYKARIRRKFGASNFYGVIAWVARERKRQGLL